MDGITQEQQSVLRKGSNIDIIFDYIVRLNTMFPNILVSIQIVLNKKNISRIKEILSKLNEFKLYKINISNLVSINKDTDMVLPTNKEIDQAYKSISEFIIESDGNTKIEANFSCNGLMFEQGMLDLSYRCNAGRSSAFIDQFGNLFPCDAVTRTSYYDLLKKNRKYSLIYSDFKNIIMQDEFRDVYKFDLEFRKGGEHDVCTKCKKCYFRDSYCSACYYLRGNI